jgi:hypothetical protein
LGATSSPGSIVIAVPPMSAGMAIARLTAAHPCRSAATANTKPPPIRADRKRPDLFIANIMTSMCGACNCLVAIAAVGAYGYVTSDRMADLG